MSKLKGYPRHIEIAILPYLSDSPKTNQRENWVGTQDTSQQHADYLEYQRRMHDLTSNRKGVY